MGADINTLTTELSRKVINISGNSTNYHVSTYNTEQYTRDYICTQYQHILITHVHELNEISKTANVHAHDPTLEIIKNIHYVDAVAAYNFPHTGKVTILKFGQAIHINFMYNNLLRVI